MTTTTLPTYTMMLARYPDRTWSVEPVGLAREPRYVPERAGPDGCVRRGGNVWELIHRDARAVVSAVLNLDTYGFDLRFCDPQGACVARSEMVYGVPPGETEPMYYELVYATPELQERARG